MASSLDLLFGGLILAGLIIFANLLALRDKEGEKMVFRWLMFAANLPLLLAGLALIITPIDILQTLLVESEPGVISAEGFKAMGPSVVFMALWGMAMSLMFVQKLLARLIAIRPGSPVHTLALVFAGYLIGNTALTLSQGGLEGLVETAEPATIDLFAIQQILFAAAGFLGAGFLVRRQGRELLKRLGLVRPTPGQLIRGVGWIILLVLIQIAAGAIWAVLNPDQVASVEDINTVLLANLDTVGEWLVFALLAGIGEEILFRGAIQPVFGLWFTSLFFAIVHVQYGFSIATLVIVILAFILGIIRRRTNTTVAIFVHAGYNFVLGLLALLATYAEQFVS
jgi:membrane protease YdiL (CAAX protease family)